MKPLPDDFRWYPWLVSGRDFGDQVLRIGGPVGMEIAMVRRRVDGETWLSEVRRYADPKPHVITHSRDRAIAWASRWAAANETAVRAALREMERRHGLVPYRRHGMSEEGDQTCAK
ncbi:hypothetical protein ASE10_15875 [Lysobacter sp. Root76]|nr:hypothetical protein ASE10_15875 [Lysobacter sp. Root76]KRD67502.1 hypothetical protein ASE45_12050 [Lysobacter sp. Root96]